MFPYFSLPVFPPGPPPPPHWLGGCGGGDTGSYKAGSKSLLFNQEDSTSHALLVQAITEPVGFQIETIGENFQFSLNNFQTIKEPSLFFLLKPFEKI